MLCPFLKNSFYAASLSTCGVKWQQSLKEQRQKKTIRCLRCLCNIFSYFFFWLYLWDVSMPKSISRLDHISCDWVTRQTTMNDLIMRRVCLGSTIRSGERDFWDRWYHSDGQKSRFSNILTLIAFQFIESPKKQSFDYSAKKNPLFVRFITNIFTYSEMRFNSNYRMIGCGKKRIRD